MGCQHLPTLHSAQAQRCNPIISWEVVVDKEEDEEIDGGLDMEDMDLDMENMDLDMEDMDLDMENMDLDMDMDMQVLLWVPEPSDPASSSGSLMQQ